METSFIPCDIELLIPRKEQYATEPVSRHIKIRIALARNRKEFYISRYEAGLHGVQWLPKIAVQPRPS